RLSRRVGALALVAGAGARLAAGAIRGRARRATTGQGGAGA
ncbi:cobalamin biosynthesis protein, partial [Streptomyces sp. SID7982]|nr:cobalamin biosynthesis protein [Streptomyces sp. SID7982]